MEQIKMPEVQSYEVETASVACVNCQARAAVPGHSTNLCDECRKLFTRYPIPLWIKLFAGGVCLVILFSLFTFPDKLSVAIYLSRGKKAADNNRFVTVRSELQQVVSKYPEHVEARAYLMLAAFYNEDYDDYIKYREQLKDVEIVNNKLSDRVFEVHEKFQNYHADDSLILLKMQYDSTTLMLPDSVMAEYVKNHPSNIYALFNYALIMHGADKYSACDSLLLQLLEIDDTYMPALRLLANTKRQLRDFNAAVKYSERLLELNKESAYAYAILSRAYLQQRRDKEGLEMAYKSMSIDDKGPYYISTMALAYHFTHQFEKRDELIRNAEALKDSTVNYYLQYVHDVINNKITFR